MNRRVLLKNILIVPFLPKLLGTLTKKKERTNYESQIVFCSESDILYEGQYVIYIKRKNPWSLHFFDTNLVWDNGTRLFYSKVRRAESWEDLIESHKENTFAGVVRKRTSCPGFVEIDAPHQCVGHGL